MNWKNVIGRVWRESPEATMRRVARRVAPSSPAAAEPPPWLFGKHQKWNRLPPSSRTNGARMQAKNG